MTRPSIGRIARVIVGASGAAAALACTCATALAQQPAPPATRPIPAPPATPSAAPPAPAPAAPPPAPALAPAAVTPAEPAPPPPELPPPPPAAAPAVVAAPVTRTPEPAPGRELASDLNVEARRWAIGYAGISQVPIASPTGGATSITVPALGLRYWAGESSGIDVALGVGWAGGSTSNGATNMDKNDVFGFVLQFGVPVALATHRHVAFELIPFFDVAYGRTSTGTGPSKTTLDGLRIDVGARAGFELFFGFIGIPELALSATVGMEFERVKVNTDAGGGLNSSNTTLAITTTVQNNPWDIFAGNVAARYYF